MASHPDARLWCGFEPDQAKLLSALVVGYRDAPSGEDVQDWSNNYTHSGPRFDSSSSVRDNALHRRHDHSQTHADPAFAPFYSHQYQQLGPSHHADSTAGKQPHSCPSVSAQVTQQTNELSPASPPFTRTPFQNHSRQHISHAVRMERMMQVFPIPPSDPIADLANVKPRVFVHQMESRKLVEVDDPDESCMPWLDDDMKKTKVYPCDLCRTWFSRPSGLLAHESAHSDDQPYKCPHTSCNRYFSIPSNARRHQHTHT